MTKQKPYTAVRLPDTLKEQLKEIAELEHWTQNQALIEATKLLVEKYQKHIN